MFAGSVFPVSLATCLAIAGCAGCIHQFLRGEPLLALAIVFSMLAVVGAALVSRRLTVPAWLALAGTVLGMMARAG